MAAQAIIKSLPAEFTLANNDYVSKRPRIDDNNSQNNQNSDELETSIYYKDQQYAGNHPNVKENLQSTKNRPDSTSPSQSKSIVSAETLENLKILSQGFNLTNYNEIKETTTKTATGALTGLAEYGSDDDEDDQENEEKEQHGSRR